MGTIYGNLGVVSRAKSSLQTGQEIICTWMQERLSVYRISLGTNFCPHQGQGVSTHENQDFGTSTPVRD
jgi:hypothetical protein